MREIRRLADSHHDRPRRRSHALSWLWLALAPLVAWADNPFYAALSEARATKLRRVCQSMLDTTQYTRAQQTAYAMIKLQAHDPHGHYCLAQALARLGQNAPALHALRQALMYGLPPDTPLTSNPHLAGLQGNADYARLLAAPPPAAGSRPVKPQARFATPRPAVVTQRMLRIGADNVSFDPQLELFSAQLALPPAGFKKLAPLVDNSPLAQNLRNWQAAGTAAGNYGDYYDNRDRDHTRISQTRFPQLIRIEYAPALGAVGLDQGLPVHVDFNRIVLGNSSTAITQGRNWRSLGRQAYTDATAMRNLYLQYGKNHLYFFPEHRDHDPGHNGQGGGYGDLLPANTPYLVLAQGSSKSEIPIMELCLVALAAMRPEVKTALLERGQIAPALQMILRMSNRRIRKPADYLSGWAHPSAFEAAQLDRGKAANLARILTPSTLPPRVHLNVEQEDRFLPGRDYFDVGARERLFDTSAAIARIYRAGARSRRMVVSAERSTDPNERPLRYHWRVLRGDPSKIYIRRLNADGSRVELQLDYQGRRPIARGAKLQSNRIDIGAFVDNGVHYSAPAFVTFLSLDNETRRYDSNGRLLFIDYNDPKTRDNYADPVLQTPKRWKDVYHYDKAGVLQGWTRHHGTRRDEFDAQGRLLVRINGRRAAFPVHYYARKLADGSLRLDYQAAKP